MKDSAKIEKKKKKIINHLNNQLKISWKYSCVFKIYITFRWIKLCNQGWIVVFFFCTCCMGKLYTMLSENHLETLLCPCEKHLMILYSNKALKHLTSQGELTESTHDAIPCTSHTMAMFQIQFWSTTSKMNLTYEQVRDSCWHVESSLSKRRNLFNPKTTRQWPQQNCWWFHTFTF